MRRMVLIKRGLMLVLCGMLMAPAAGMAWAPVHVEAKGLSDESAEGAGKYELGKEASGDEVLNDTDPIKTSAPKSKDGKEGEVDPLPGAKADAKNELDDYYTFKEPSIPEDKRAEAKAAKDAQIAAINKCNS